MPGASMRGMPGMANFMGPDPVKKLTGGGRHARITLTVQPAFYCHAPS